MEMKLQRLTYNNFRLSRTKTSIDENPPNLLPFPIPRDCIDIVWPLDPHARAGFISKHPVGPASLRDR